MWQELLDLLAKGLLAIPPGVRVIFTDAGQGFIRTDADWSRLCDGVYYHTAMYNGEGNQLSEGIPVTASSPSSAKKMSTAGFAPTEGEQEEGGETLAVKGVRQRGRFFSLMLRTSDLSRVKRTRY